MPSNELLDCIDRINRLPEPQRSQVLALLDLALDLAQTTIALSPVPDSLPLLSVPEAQG